MRKSPYSVYNQVFMQFSVFGNFLVNFHVV